MKQYLQTTSIYIILKREKMEDIIGRIILVFINKMMAYKNELILHTNI